MSGLLDEINRWWSMLSMAATLGYGWCLYELSRRFVSKEEHAAVARAQDVLCVRVDELKEGSANCRMCRRTLRAGGRAPFAECRTS